MLCISSWEISPENAVFSIAFSGNVPTNEKLQLPTAAAASTRSPKMMNGDLDEMTFILQFNIIRTKLSILLKRTSVASHRFMYIFLAVLDYCFQALPSPSQPISPPD